MSTWALCASSGEPARPPPLRVRRNRGLTASLHVRTMVARAARCSISGAFRCFQRLRLARSCSYKGGGAWRWGMAAGG